MKLVVEIPDNEYSNVLKGHWEGNPLADYIENGKLLPKGHGRLIDADELIKDYGNPDIEILLENMDTIIEADKEVKDDGTGKT